MFHSSSQIKGFIVFHRSSQIQPKHNLKRLLKNFQLLFFPIFSLLLSSMPLFFFLFCFFVIFSILFSLFPLLLPFPIFLFSWEASQKALISTSESRNIELTVLIWIVHINCNAPIFLSVTSRLRRWITNTLLQLFHDPSNFLYFPMAQLGRPSNKTWLLRRHFQNIRVDKKNYNTAIFF